jgi:hypothetical protein
MASEKINKHDGHDQSDVERKLYFYQRKSKAYAMANEKINKHDGHDQPEVERKLYFIKFY